jgi:phage-related tail fiber protein
MVDKNSIFGGMLTIQGAAKKTNCDALGIPWEPRYMLIGDANGTDPVPNPSQIKLINQVYRAQINQLYVSPTDANVLIAELVLPPDVGGWWVRELALEDKDGVFSAVANAAPSYKPQLEQNSGRNQVVRMHIIISGTANIQLKIDPSVVLATRQYVDVTINGLLPANKVAGTYTKVTVNDRGVFVSGSNPTTLAGFGITNAFTKTETTDLINGALTIPVVTVSVSKSLLAADLGLVLISADAAAVTVELPESSAALGVRDVVVRRTDNTGNRLVIKASGTNKIKFHTHLRAEGYPFFVLMGAGDYWHLRSDGAGNWFPVARFDPTSLGRPVFETTTAFSPGGWVGHNGFLYSRAEWPWAWDHAQASGMLTTEALRAGKEGCWTSGDGVTTFRSPEARGEFMRVLDESRGVDAARVAGSWQDGTWLRTVAQEWSGSDSAAGAYILGNAHAQADGRISTIGVGGAVPPGALPPGGSPYTYSAATTDNGVKGEAVVDTVYPVNNWIRFRSRNIAYPGRIKLI